MGENEYFQNSLHEIFKELKYFFKKWKIWSKKQSAFLESAETSIWSLGSINILINFSLFFENVLFINIIYYFSRLKDSPSMLIYLFVQTQY